MYIAKINVYYMYNAKINVYYMFNKRLDMRLAKRLLNMFLSRQASHNDKYSFCTSVLKNGL